MAFRRGSPNGCAREIDRFYQGRAGWPSFFDPQQRLLTAIPGPVEAESFGKVTVTDQQDALTHVDQAGAARMVDVGTKPVTERVAVARATVRAASTTLETIRAGAARKGDVVAVARLAGIMAAKRTSELIPLCHQIQLSSVDVDIDLSAATTMAITTTAKTTGPTGVEMEALIAASLAALTVYDMCKAVDRGMTIEEVCLVEKSGGRSGAWRRDQPA